MDEIWSVEVRQSFVVSITEVKVTSLFSYHHHYQSKNRPNILSTSFFMSPVDKVEVWTFQYYQYLFSALLISGGSPSASGKSVEVFVPSTGQHCALPDLPNLRHSHTIEGMVLCGGGTSGIGTMTTCLTLNGTGWETTTTLLERR